MNNYAFVDAQNLYLGLKDLGWNVITVWECKLKPKNFEETLKKTMEEIISINSL